MTVCVGSGRDDSGVEEVVAWLLSEPEEVTYGGRSWDAVELDLERHTGFTDF
jgi:hypothetical protein